MKLMVDAATDRVVGCHLLDPDAAEIVQGVGIAMKCGATKAQFDRTMALHPTAAEEIVTMRTPARRLRRGEEAGRGRSRLTPLRSMGSRKQPGRNKSWRYGGSRSAGGPAS